MWNAEAELAKRYNSDIKIIVPNDGYAISMDNYCILKNSKNSENAYLLINYLLREDVNRRIIESYPYISTVKNINTYKQHMEEYLAESEVIYPPEEILQRGQSYGFLPEDITRYVENLFLQVRLN